MNAHQKACGITLKSLALGGKFKKKKSSITIIGVPGEE